MRRFATTIFSATKRDYGSAPGLHFRTLSVFLCTSIKSTSPYGMHLLPYLLMTQRCPIEVLIKNMSCWLEENKLTLDTSKSNFMLIANSKKLKNVSHFKLTINNCTLLERESTLKLE